MAVIAMGYAIINEWKKQEKDVDDGWRNGCCADPV